MSIQLPSQHCSCSSRLQRTQQQLGWHGQPMKVHRNPELKEPIALTATIAWRLKQKARLRMLLMKMKLLFLVQACPERLCTCTLRERTRLRCPARLHLHRSARAHPLAAFKLLL